MPNKGQEKREVGTDELLDQLACAVDEPDGDSVDDFDDDLDDWFFNTDEKGERWVFE